MRWSWGRWWQLQHTSRPRIANEPPSFRGFGGFCCLPDRLVSCRRLLGPKIEKRHRRLAARSGGAGAAAGSVPRCASLKLFWMSSKVPAPGRVAGGDGSRLLNAPPIANAPTRGAACAALRVAWAPRRVAIEHEFKRGRTPREHSAECVVGTSGWGWLLVFQPRGSSVESVARHDVRVAGDARVPLLRQQSRVEDQALQPPARVLRLRRRRGCREPGRRHLAVPPHVESTPLGRSEPPT